MRALPVISSIIAPEALANFVRERYALPGGVRCQLLKAGVNHSYRIDAGSEAFVFRIYARAWRTAEEISEELELLAYLRRDGLAVSYPLADASGALIQRIEAPEGRRFGVLFSFAKGHKVQQYDAAIHFAAGQLMARIHRLTIGRTVQRATYTTEVLLEQSLAHIRRFLSDDTPEMQFLLATRPLLAQRLQQADSSQIRQGVVHLDIWFDNFSVSDTGEITLFDFDFCGNGPLCLDIAYYVMQLCNLEKDENERAEKMKAFYAGYESLQTISAEEKRLIPVLGVCLYYFYLGVQCQRFNDWSNVFVNEVYLKKYITFFIKSYYQNHAAAGV